MLKQILLKFLHKEIQQIKQEQYGQGYTLGKYRADDERRAEAIRVRGLVMESNIGKKVIYTSNEWEDPTFAIIEGLETFHNVDGVMYKARDVLTNQTLYFFQDTLYLADERIVDALLKLNPVERWSIKVYRENIHQYPWNKEYSPGRKITDPAILKQKLKEVGFI